METCGAVTDVVAMVDLDFGSVPDYKEAGLGTTPGGFLCVNDDDDDHNGTPDKDDAGPTLGEDDLMPLTITADGAQQGTLTLSAVSGGQRIKLYENPDRSNPVSLPTSWNLFALPKTFSTVLYVEGIAPSAALRDTELVLDVLLQNGDACDDHVKLTVFRVKIDPITSGIDPVPINPAIVAPVDVGLDDGTTFNQGNKFELTELSPDIDLTTLPVQWDFVLTEGSINPDALLLVDTDRRGARFSFPPFSFGNFGAGRVVFSTSGHECKSVDTRVRNIQPDLEPRDFRFHVKAHLCTDGQGVSTSRTPAEVRSIMSDVTKVLSQCGIIVTTSEVVTTVVDPAYLNLDSAAMFAMWNLFGTDAHATAIDMYFILTIDPISNQGCGATAGVTGSPAQSGPLFEAGIAIADSTCDGPLTGGTLVRTVAHEITHYLLNHANPINDHSSNPQNLMYGTSSDTKRDVDENQSLELRTNSGVD